MVLCGVMYVCCGVVDCVVWLCEWRLCVYNCVSGVIQLAIGNMTNGHFYTSAHDPAPPPSVRIFPISCTPSMPCFCYFPAFGRGRLKPHSRSRKNIPRKQLPLTLKPPHSTRHLSFLSSQNLPHFSQFLTYFI